MFRESIQKVVDRVDGGIAGILMGFDGIAVESYTKAGQTTDIQTVGMELAHVLTQMRRAAELMEVGKLQETIFRADQLTVIVAPLNEEYFLGVALAPGGNLGKVRYLMRLLVPQLLKEL